MNLLLPIDQLVAIINYIVDNINYKPELLQTKSGAKLGKSEMTHYYRPADGHGLKHDPFKALLGPRIIGWISSRSRSGRANLAPYSFFGAFSSKPMVIGFSSDDYKDSVRNIEETGQFVWNYVTRELAPKMNITSAHVGPQRDEFELAGLEKAPGRSVDVPRVAAAPAALECQAIEVKRLRSVSGMDIGNWLVLGEVVGVAINEDYLRDGLFDVERAQPVMRAGYRGDYFGLGEKFELIRPGPEFVTEDARRTKPY